MKRSFHLLLTSLVLCSCATFEKNAQLTVGAIDIAVTVALNIWNQEVMDGKVSDGDVATVQKAFDAYQTSKKILADALTAYRSNPDAGPVQIAINALQASASDIVDLVRLLLPADKTVNLRTIKRQ